MDFNILIGSIQLAIAAFQLKLDHFSKSSNRQELDDMEQFYRLGEAIRLLEYALSETVAFVGQTNNREPNQRLASLWENVSRTIRTIRDGADLADLTFEKHLYWRNPGFYRGQDVSKLFRISLNNVLIQLRQLRSKYDKLQNKISE
ncbi:hypothetical protein [Sphingobacterium mizutaii]|uniref:hypothetical protein n=1 Tax=Sphingobacterium mizutaii TaxID=1010 RepID=UPI00289D9F45|nr:hypothetical protein [Sphingobacterium mizutaii]